jgi:hypothetical protein
MGGPVRARLELWSAVLLAAATVVTAYSAYESTRWSGVQATSFTQAGAARTQSAKATTEGYSLASIDAGLFTQYAVAFTEGNRVLQRALETRFFRDEFLPAFKAWVKQRPLQNPNADKNPFQTKQYTSAALDEAKRLDAEADAKFAEGTEANQNSDDYVLATIFFASVLFFAGIASKFHSDRAMGFLLGFGTFAFFAGLGRVGTLPFH